MLYNLLLLLAGFGLLVWSADRFVYGAAALARNLGVSPLVIGLTIVAMGSSAPEMMVAATASLEGVPNTAIGNAIGSNITNICLVLGVTALLQPLLVSSSTVRRELPMVLLTTLAAGWVLYDTDFTRPEGIALMVGFFAVIIGLTVMAIKRPNNQDPMVEEAESEVPADVPMKKAIFWLVVGMIVLPLSANLLVDAAVFIAKWFGMSDLVIGLTIIAIGTSLPELAACIAGVLKKEDDLAIGNIVGSNIFNILAVLAIPGILAPGAVDPNAAGRDFYYMLGATVVLMLMAMSFGGTRRINRLEGGVLLLGFIAYQCLLFYNHGV